MGICFGMQMAVIETMRHLAGIKDANTTEIAGGSCTPVVGLMTEWDKEGAKQIRTKDGDLGGTMRLGAYESVLAPRRMSAAFMAATEFPNVTVTVMRSISAMSRF